MKRIISTLVCMAVILLNTQAFAITDLEAQVYNHNSYTEKTGASIIEGNPEVDNDLPENYIAYKYEVNGVIIFFATSEEKVTMVYCMADDAHFSEFFSQCLSCMYNFMGENSSYLWASTFLEELAAAKAGKRASLDDMDKTARMVFGYIEGKYFFGLRK